MEVTIESCKEKKITGRGFLTDNSILLDIHCLSKKGIQAGSGRLRPAQAGSSLFAQAYRLDKEFLKLGMGMETE